jgi:hypothetical protein
MTELAMGAAAALGLSSLFGGGGGAAAEAAAKEREMSRVAQERQQQQANDQAAETGGAFAGTKSVRGQRLLLSDKSGGLATTLGAA